MPNWFFDEGYASAVGPNAVSVYMCLRKHENRNGESFPGMTRIMEQTGLTKPTVLLAIKALLASGTVEEIRGKDVPGKHSQAVLYTFSRPDELVKALYRSKSFTSKGPLPNRSSAFTQPVKGLYQPYTIKDSKTFNKSTDSTIDTDSDTEWLSIFENFWKLYPRKENKAKAKDWWRRNKPDKATRILIGKSLETYKKTTGWIEGFVPHAITWLNGKRWEDEPMAVIKSGEAAVNGFVPRRAPRD